MKTKYFGLVGIIFLFCGIVLANETRNGGQLVAARFVAKSWEILRHLEYVQTNLLDEKQRIDLQLGIYNTKVIAIKGPLISNEGLVVDVRVVTNAQGEKTIELDVDKWETLINDPSVNLIILHEYLRVTAINDDQYQVSSRLKMSGSDKPILLPGIYKSNGGTFQVTSDGFIGPIKKEEWPFVFYLPDFPGENSINFVTGFPHRFRYNSKEGYWETTASTNSYYCRLTANVYIRSYEDTKELEITIVHPTRLYNGCETYGTKRMILHAERIK